MMRRVSFGWLLIFLLSILLLLAGGRLAPRDEETTYRMTANLIERGQLTLTQQEFTVEPQPYAAFLPQATPRTQATTWIVPGPNGESYPLYTHAQPVLQIPLYLIGRLIGGAPLDLASVAWTRFLVSLLNPIVIALTGWLIALFGSRWGFSARLSIGLGVMYSLGTMAVVYTHTNFSDPLLTLLFTLAAYGAYRADSDRRGRWLILTGVALGLALYLRERALIWLPLYLGYLLFTRRARNVHDWLAEMTIALVRHYSELGNLPVTSVHIGECSGTMIRG
ncbi:MAG: glycosyltransferase family 39 protein, partial [Chloroflexi bacterium]|nr:glycosyltransferase family 39 protein [Chloroflexota bacterium]